jgi:Ca2+-binding RTX toxin-like protein
MSQNFASNILFGDVPEALTAGALPSRGGADVLRDGFAAGGQPKLVAVTDLNAPAISEDASLAFSNATHGVVSAAATPSVADGISDFAIPSAFNSDFAATNDSAAISHSGLSVSFGADHLAPSHALMGGGFSPTNAAPEIHNYDATFADDGTFTYSLQISLPTDLDGDTLTVTIDQVPNYGIVEYFDSGSSSFVQVTGGETLTADQLTTLQYTPDASGEHGGDSVVYTVSDGTDSTTGSIEINDVAEEDAGPPFPVLFFSAQGPSPAAGADLYLLDPFGDLQAVPLRADFTGDPSPDSGSRAGEDGGFVHFAGNFLFFADVFDGTSVVNDQLMVLGGAPFPLPFTGITGVTGGNAHFTEYAGALYFEANTPDGTQLMKIDADGTPSEILVNASGNAAPGETGGLTVLDGGLYFSAFTDTSGINNQDLVKLDIDGLHNISTRAVPSNGSAAGEDGGLFAYNHTLYFNAFSDVTNSETLFKLAADSLTPTEVDPTGGVLNHESGVSAAFHIFDGNLYVNEFSGALGGDTLFKIDALGNLSALDFGGQALNNAGATGYGDFGGSLYFAANPTGSDNDLFRLDADGTLTALNINATGDSNAGENGGFINFNGALYFMADDSVLGGVLYKLDSSGVAAPVDAGAAGEIGTALGNTGEDAHFTIFADTLVLRALTSAGDELVQIGIDGSVTLYDVNFDPSGNSFPGQNGGFGVYPQTTLTGTSGNDILVGCSDFDTLLGGAGNDLLQGRELNDVLTGGDGADIFKFSDDGPQNVDIITDYTFIANDVIDLSDLLPVFQTGVDVVAEYARLVVSGTDLVVQVDQDGTGTSFTWTEVAILEGGNGPGTQQATLVFGGTNQVVGEVTEIAPTVGVTGGTTASFEQTPIVVDAGITVGDADDALLSSAAVYINAGWESSDQLDADTTGTNITAFFDSSQGVLILDGVDTVANYQAVLRSVTYQDDSDAPSTTDRGIEFTVNDGTFDSTIATKIVSVTPVDDAPVAQDDDVFTDEVTVLNGNLFDDNSFGPDTDVDGPALSISAVNGSAANLGVQITLTSGALLTVHADGTFTYDPNHAFDSLAPFDSGALNFTGFDSFQYTLTGGGTATVQVAIDGVAGAGTIYEGNSSNNEITGDPSLDSLFHLEQGGNDHAIGGSGNDGFYFGTAFDANDVVNGGDGNNDQIGLEGDYSGGITLGPNTITNIEVIACLPGFSYNLTTVDENVGAGNTLTIWASRLVASNTLTFDGSAELDGKFIVFGGAGNDSITGGAGNDKFYGLGGADTLTGNGGADTFVYTKVSESTGNTNGTAYDTIVGFDAAADHFDLPGSVTGVDAQITTGALSSASFDGDLATVVGSGQLGAHHAVLFTADGGSLATHTFLVVDANGVAGYQAGLDFVFDVSGGSNLGTLGTGAFI